jgi:hypothetical protein
MPHLRERIVMRIADSTSRLRMSGIALLTALAFTTSDALAHEKAVLRSTLSTVAAGRSLPLTGADFTPGVSYRLILLGALREYDLRHIEGEPDSTFDLALSIPPRVVPGVYKLVAIAPDGDRVASLDLTILEPVATETDSQGDPDERGEPERAEMHEAARADEMPIQRSRNGSEWGAIGLVIGLAAGLGVTLIRRS